MADLMRDPPMAHLMAPDEIVIAHARCDARVMSSGVTDRMSSDLTFVRVGRTYIYLLMSSGVTDRMSSDLTFARVGRTYCTASRSACIQRSAAAPA